jgi:hypothetical protein
LRRNPRFYLGRVIVKVGRHTVCRRYREHGCGRELTKAPVLSELNIDGLRLSPWALTQESHLKSHYIVRIKRREVGKDGTSPLCYGIFRLPRLVEGSREIPLTGDRSTEEAIRRGVSRDANQHGQPRVHVPESRPVEGSRGARGAGDGDEKDFQPELPS